MTRLSRLVALVVCIHSMSLTAFAGLREDVERLVRTAPLKGATVAVSIRDCGSGSPLVAINPESQMVPASNMKLLTTGAALHALGANFEFTTRLVRRGDQLIVLGDGDPAFGDPELLTEMSLNGQEGVDVETFVDLWVKAVQQANITEVGQLLVDDRIFDREFVHPSWPADQLNNRYCAQVAGLNFHANVLHFFPKPRRGEPPQISGYVPAAPWLKVTNAGTSRESAKDKNDAWVARKINTNELTFRGNVRFAYKVPVPVTIHDAPDFFARLLADRLKSAGIPVHAARACEKNDPESVGEAVGPIITTPISTAITRCNTESENLYAECLLKRIGFAMTGEPGSWTNGGAIVRHIIHKRLEDAKLTSGFVIADGSGLSSHNRITAAGMTAWLNSFHNDEKLGQMFIDSLAVGGQSGTLQKRFGDSSKLHGATVHAKTGYINQVSCLSGFVSMPDGRRRAFSVLVNNLSPATVSLAKKMQDQIVMSIAEDMSNAAVSLGSD